MVVTYIQFNGDHVDAPIIVPPVTGVDAFARSACGMGMKYIMMHHWICCPSPCCPKLVAITTITQRAQCDRRGGPWGGREAPSQGVRPFAVAQGASQPAFWVGWLTWKNVRVHNFNSQAVHLFQVFGACAVAFDLSCRQTFT